MRDYHGIDHKYPDGSEISVGDNVAMYCCVEPERCLTGFIAESEKGGYVDMGAEGHWGLHTINRCNGRKIEEEK